MVLPDRIELSTSPLPMECSTTELRQHAREQNRPRRPRQAGGSCHKGPSGASTGRGPGPPKSAEIGLSAFFALRSPPIPGRSVPYRWSAGLYACSGRSFTESTIFLAVPNAMRRALAAWAVHVPSRLVYLVYSWPQNLHSNCPGMNDDQDKRGGPTGPLDSRQERLKLALRENLKRRKSQARGRSDAGSASSGHEDAALDDASGKKPVR